MTGSRLYDPAVSPRPGGASPPPMLRAAGVTLVGLFRQRAVQLAVVGWCAVNALVLILAEDTLPFDWPALPSISTVDRLVESNLVMLEAFLLMAVACALTRRRVRPAVGARAPQRTVALRETVLLLGYGVLGLVGGALLARAFGWHPFGWHLAGSIYGTHEHVEPAEVIAWAGYNLIVYAVVPLAVFRRRYPAEALNLRSTNRRNDSLVIAVVLLIESVLQVVALRAVILDLTPRQLTLGVPLTFVLYLAGAVLPAMIFVYAILLPRYLRLTGSTAATVILGGLTYAAWHLWDAWTVFSSARGAALSVAFLLLTYAGPGMIKSLLTLRTGNAWVHVWAYHALVPHTLIDTPHLVEAMHIR